MEKEQIISNTYYDLGGFSSVKNTLEQARKKEPSIKYQDVKTWFGLSTAGFWLRFWRHWGFLPENVTEK